MDFELSVDLILARLPDTFAQFMLAYGMDHIISTIPEMIDVLKIANGKMVENKGKETAPKETCFYCGHVGHWKRNCKAYLESKRKVACDAPSSSGIYVIKVNNVSLNNIWVYDTNYGSYIWIDMQGLRNNRKLTKGESNFRMGNGARVIVVALWTYVLNLPSDLWLNLDNCCYVPALTKNFSSFLFEKKWFLFIFCNNGCYIMMSFMLVVH